MPARAPLPVGKKSQTSAEEKAYETALAAAALQKETLTKRIDALEMRKAGTTRMKSMFRVIAAFLAMTLGMSAWILSQQISRTEREIDEFDERTEARAGFSDFLRELFGGKVPDEWSERDLNNQLRFSDARWLRLLSSQLGASTFARYAIRRGKALGFLESRDLVAEDSISEMYKFKRFIEPDVKSPLG